MNEHDYEKRYFKLNNYDLYECTKDNKYDVCVKLHKSNTKTAKNYNDTNNNNMTFDYDKYVDKFNYFFDISQTLLNKPQQNYFLNPTRYVINDIDDQKVSSLKIDKYMYINIDICYKICSFVEDREKSNYCLVIRECNLADINKKMDNRYIIQAEFFKTAHLKV